MRLMSRPLSPKSGRCRKLDSSSASNGRDTFRPAIHPASGWWVVRQARLAMGISQRELGRRIGFSEEVVSSRVTSVVVCVVVKYP